MVLLNPFKSLGNDTDSLFLSKQKGKPLHLQTRRRRSDQRLGHWCYRHVCRRRTPAHSPRPSRVRQQGRRRHTGQFSANIRLETVGDQISLLLDRIVERGVRCLGG